ncbi:MAG: hypothetical protein ACPKPY_02320 [Nitrososphaeraceae archaeon]
MPTELEHPNPVNLHVKKRLTIAKDTPHGIEITEGKIKSIENSFFSMEVHHSSDDNEPHLRINGAVGSDNKKRTILNGNVHVGGHFACANRITTSSPKAHIIAAKGSLIASQNDIMALGPGRIGAKGGAGGESINFAGNATIQADSGDIVAKKGKVIAETSHIIAAKGSLIASQNDIMALGPGRIGARGGGNLGEPVHFDTNATIQADSGDIVAKKGNISAPNGTISGKNIAVEKDISCSGSINGEKDISCSGSINGNVGKFDKLLVLNPNTGEYGDVFECLRIIFNKLNVPMPDSD